MIKTTSTFFNQSGKSLLTFFQSHPFLKWTTLFFGGILFLFFAFYLTVLVGVFGKLPSKTDLQQVHNPEASEVYAADSTLIGRFFTENRTSISYEEISPALVQALIATEDARFYDHSGVDIRSMVRVFFKSILLQDAGAGGGSTLSQQLAKNLFPRKRHSILTLLVNKTKEWILANRLEKVYPKEDLLTLYANTVSFGENTYGVETASKRFFGKSASGLLTEQAALLVGMLKAPNTFNPRLYPLAAVQRRSHVLNQMVKYGYLKASTADSLNRLPMHLDYHSRDLCEGVAPYFKEQVRREISSILATWKHPDGNTNDLYTDGLKIYTTLDMDLQRHAQKAVLDHMQSLQKEFRVHWKGQEDKELLTRLMKRSIRYRSLLTQGVAPEKIEAIFHSEILLDVFSYETKEKQVMSPWDSLIAHTYLLQAGLVSISPENGAVKAWVGGIDPDWFPYDHAKARRQTGSVFKPIVYASALENGIRPCDYISNERPEFRTHPGWVPQNADREYGGEYSMEGGLTHSVNVVAANLIMQTGAENVVKTARKMGITGEIPAVPAIALGAASASPLEMASAYSTLANRGTHFEPRFITAFRDVKGRTFPFFALPEPGLDSTNADIMVRMLESVVANGTASSLKYRYGFENDIAGKTGTTQNQADGWFVGITPKLVTAVWVGADNPQVHFRTLAQGQGAHMALPIWAGFMKSVYKDPQFMGWQEVSFPAPSPLIRDQLACAHVQSSLYMDAFREFFESIDKFK